MAYDSRSYPDRTGSTDSHLLPAGIRHVPRGSRDPPPPRPWQSHRQQAQRVRFDDSFDENLERRPGILRTGIPLYGHGSSRSPTRPQRPSYEPQAFRPELPSEDTWDGGRGSYDDLRPEEVRRRRQDSSNVIRPVSIYETRERRRRESEDNNQRQYTSHSFFGPETFRSRSPEPIVKPEPYSDAEEFYEELETGRRPVPTESRTARSRSPSETSTIISNSDSEDEAFVTDVYEFSPSYWTVKELRESELTASMFSVSGESTGAKEGRGTEREGHRFLQLYQSEYTGDGYPEGSHSAKLTAVLDGKRGRQPLFRWRHVTQTTMSFEDLSVSSNRGHTWSESLTGYTGRSGPYGWYIRQRQARPCETSL